MIKFILNNTEVSTDQHPGTAVLDFIRYRQNLTGTKIGCREGDCGACTVLVGELTNGDIRYRSMTSCLMPLANANGKHIVTVEGINGDGLNPVQQAMYDESATQCGFCTPGFVMSMVGFSLQHEITNAPKEAVDSVDGNICRCTGYKSIQRAATRVGELVSTRKSDPVAFAIEQKFVPEYFASIPSRLKALSDNLSAVKNIEVADYRVGGGTDLYVQKHEAMSHAKLDFFFDNPAMKGIRIEGNRCILGASTTVTDLVESKEFRKLFPDFEIYYKLVSSTPIRNMATIAGNIVNASPIGDFTAFFLALNASVLLTDDKSSREIELRKFYLGYKKLDKRPEEYIKTISFEIPSKHTRFNFEKVSKRTNLDIASVNTAIRLDITEGIISNAGVSAGGIGPIPTYLFKASEYLNGKKVSLELLPELISIVQSEIAPISDARGTEEYKRLLLSQLLKAHFLVLFPELDEAKILTI
ncbi:MAG: FAD binding domain-containing protein [Bacteroidetes bacterium]|nr:FAD binding domain-containing protein [Bacteroidota bacterium]